MKTAHPTKLKRTSLPLFQGVNYISAQHPHSQRRQQPSLQTAQDEDLADLVRKLRQDFSYDPSIDPTVQ